MASIRQTVVTAKTSGTPTTQDITISGIGTPTACIIIANGATGLGVPAAHLRAGFSLYDGSTARAFCSWSENGLPGGSADTGGRVTQSTNAVDMCATSSTAQDGLATYVSFITDGVQIDWSSYPASAYRLTVIFFLGMSASCLELTSSAIINDTVTVSGLTFQPKVLIGATPRLSFGGGITHSNGRLSLSFAADDGPHGITQATYGYFDRDNPTGSVSGICSAQHNNRFLHQSTLSAGLALTEAGQVEVTAFNPDGYVLTTRDVADGVTGAYLALGGFTGRAWVGTPDLSTQTTGNKTVTTPGFRPQAIFSLACMILNSSLNSTSETANARFSFGLVDSNGTEGCNSWNSDDNVSTTAAGGSVESTTIHLFDGSGADWMVLNHVSKNADGFTINVGTASTGSSRCTSFLVIGEDLPNTAWMDHGVRANVHRRQLRM